MSFHPHNNMLRRDAVPCPCAGEEVARRRQTTPHCLSEGSCGPGALPGLPEAHATLIREAPAHPCARLHPEWGEPTQRPPPGPLTWWPHQRCRQQGRREAPPRLAQAIGLRPGWTLQMGQVAGNSESFQSAYCVTTSAPTAGSPLPGTQRPCTQQRWA